MLDKALKTILLLSSVVYMNGRTLDSFDVLFFHAAFLFLLFLFPFPKNSKTVLSIFLVSLLGITALQGFQQVPMICLMNLAVGFYVINLMIQTAEYKTYSNIFILAILINLGLVLLSSFDIFQVIENPRGEPGGMFGNTPRLCYFLAITMPFVFERFKRTLPLYFITGIMFKEVYLSIFALMIFARDFRKYVTPRTFALLAVTGILCFVAIFKTQLIQSVNIRWLVWEPTLSQIFVQPMFGYGLGMFKYLSSQFIVSSSQADNTFSSFIQFFFACGFAGLIGLGYICREMLRGVKLNAPTLSLIFLLVLSIFEYPFEVPKLWLTICFIIAVFIKENKIGGVHAIHQS